MTESRETTVESAIAEPRVALARWPRIVRARIVGARRDRHADWRPSRYVERPGHEVIFTLANIGDRPLQSVRVLSDAVVTRDVPSRTVVPVSVLRWWVTGHSSYIPRGGIEIVVGPIATSPANFVGGIFLQYQSNPLCPCQRHNAARRASGECVCRVNGVIAPCSGVARVA